jgi:hypothetical protein
MHKLPLTPQHKQKEWTNILHTAKTNGYPLSIITKLNTHLQQKLLGLQTTNVHANKPNLLTIFTFYSPFLILSIPSVRGQQYSLYLG